jgi:hypothetical protein
MAWLYTILMINLLLSYPSSYPDPGVPPGLCPRLITSKDLIPLLVSPIHVLFSPEKSLTLILVRKRWLFPRNPPGKALPFKGCPDSFLPQSKPKMAGILIHGVSRFSFEAVTNSISRFL